jgi:hypothetical protein
MLNTRYALLGWLVWQVGKRRLRKKLVPRRLTIKVTR